MILTLSDLRNKKGKTQKEMAKELHVGFSTIAMWETGARTPSLKMATKLAQYFEVRVEDIFFGLGAHEMRVDFNGQKVVNN